MEDLDTGPSDSSSTLKETFKNVEGCSTLLTNSFESCLRHKGVKILVKSLEQFIHYPTLCELVVRRLVTMEKTVKFY